MQIFEKVIHQSNQRNIKMDGCSFQQVLRQNLGWLLS